MISRIELIKISLIAIVLLAIIQVVSAAGVTHPAPTQLELTKGESGRFKFQIQNRGEAETVTCAAGLEGSSPLVIEFDDEAMVVVGEEIKYFYGTVSVPDDEARAEMDLNPIELGAYTQTFCVQCEKEDVEMEGGGSAVQIRTCDLPININVVGVRTRENMQIIPKPVQADIMLTMIIIIAVGIGMLIVILWLLYKKRKGP